jgi:hypothetical protein
MEPAMKQPGFDLADAHRYFAAYCFNAAWDLIEKSDRTPADDRLMVALSQASLYHWLNRPDLTDRNLSIAYWQLSRVHVLTGAADLARRYAELSLELSRELQPFQRAYAHEALARAAAGMGDEGLARQHLRAAQDLAKQVEDPGDRALLEADLKTLGG